MKLYLRNVLRDCDETWNISNIQPWGYMQSFGTLPPTGQEIAKNGLFLAYNFWTLSCMITIVPSWAVSEQHHILDKNSK